MSAASGSDPISLSPNSHRNVHRLTIGAAVAAAVAVGSGLVSTGLGERSAAVAVWTAATAIALTVTSVSVGRQLWRRQPGVDVIALLALVGTLTVGEALAGAVIAAMLATGRALEIYAQGRAQRELVSLLSRVPRIAHRATSDGLHDVPLAEVIESDILVVRPGEVLPVDGIVMDTPAVLDESALTGEALPVDRPVGSAVRSGTVNAGASMRIRVVASAEHSMYSGIVKLVATARESRSPMTRLADQWAAGFVPLTVLTCILVAVLTRDAPRVVAVLVVATPCPLLIAVPIALVSGVSRAAARGVVVKGAAALERMARADTLLVDKTGTRTSGHAILRDVEAPGHATALVLALAASAEQHSHHVLAASIVEAADVRGIAIPEATGAREDAGLGVVATVDGVEVRVGRLDWAAEASPPWVQRLARRCSMDGSTLVAVGRQGVLLGALILDDVVRPDSARTLRRLREDGIRRVVMVTGDRAEIAEPIGSALGVDAVLAGCSPSEKVEAVRTECITSHRGVIMVGDGINDAAALAAADVGVALGARGSSASSEAADIVITVDRLDRLGVALRIAQRTRDIALQSVVVGMSLSIIAMAFAGLGLLTPVAGAFAQEAIDVIAILNALRALGGIDPRKPKRDASALTARFRGEHDSLRGDIERIRAIADGLEDGVGREGITPARELHHFLIEVVLVHERAEETQLYPMVARLLGGDDPTGPMSRGHAEIERFIRLYGLALDEVGDNEPTPEDIIELRRLLYGLHAVLRLHTAQEDEAYLSLVEPIDQPLAV